MTYFTEVFCQLMTLVHATVWPIASTFLNLAVFMAGSLYHTAPRDFNFWLLLPILCVFYIFYARDEEKGPTYPHEKPHAGRSPELSRRVPSIFLNSYTPCTPRDEPHISLRPEDWHKAVNKIEEKPSFIRSLYTSESTGCRVAPERRRANLHSPRSGEEYTATIQKRFGAPAQAITQPVFRSLEKERSCPKWRSRPTMPGSYPNRERNWYWLVNYCFATLVALAPSGPAAPPCTIPDVPSSAPFSFAPTRPHVPSQGYPHSPMVVDTPRALQPFGTPSQYGTVPAPAPPYMPRPRVTAREIRGLRQDFGDLNLWSARDVDMLEPQMDHMDVDEPAEVHQDVIMTSHRPYTDEDVVTAY